MVNQSGNISVTTENIFPIIKRWLYSDKDIFLRELVSNSCDAISKHKRLVGIGEATAVDGDKYSIHVELDKSNKTLKIIDNGIGMTAEEIDKYINQIAFSSAEEFLSKYKDKNDEGSQIIGHFGLGFYSAFMVSDKVEIKSLSYKEGSEAALWVCEGGVEYTISASEKTDHGTEITLHIGKDSEEFLEQFRLNEILRKYCYFLPVEIFVTDVEQDKKRVEDADKTDLSDDAEQSDSADKTESKQPKPINNTSPLWLKNPSDCTDDDYKAFFTETFHDFESPLFWIHLNVEYPFKLKGILYFPKLKPQMETMEGQIKLFNNQVFVADNIKEVIPEFLMLLKGVLDCPEIPLNVSRSFLQNDGYVKKISTHITKKVSDKLSSLFNNDRENYNKYWDDISPFVKYGCIRDEKFYDRVKEIILYKTISNQYQTLKDYIGSAEDQKQDAKNTVFYVTDENQQSQYIKMFKQHDMDAVLLTTFIDNHFINFIEMKETEIKFNRIDSDISETMKEELQISDEDKEKLEKIFKDTLQDDKLKIQIENLKSKDISAVILLSEQSRRMQDMSKQFGNPTMMFPSEFTLGLNISNPLIQSLIPLSQRLDRSEDLKLICKQIYDMAMLGHKQLEAEALTQFIHRSNDLLIKFAEES